MEWLDGSESMVLSTLRHASDRSSSSDELASAIRNWPTRYHFSKLRSKILAPLRVTTGSRVLDLGGGTGTLTRKLGELGAEVLLLDGSPQRAQAAAVRCEGLKNVTVAVGTVFDLDDTVERFDLVLAVGVLEYAQPAAGGADAFLQRASSLVSPNGALAIAIENAIGLKYLLGYAEDHVNRPWIGLEDYVGIDHVRTYSRRQLGAMLASAGLPEHAWLFPFPDYKLPEVILSERAYAREKADLVDALVRRPCSPDASLPVLLCDARRAHRTMLRAGIGPEISNSFLVVAAPSTQALDERVDRDTLAWLAGTERRAKFMRDRRLVSEDSALAIVDDDADAGSVEERWLRQHRFASIPYVAGEPVDELLVDALAAGDLARAQELLGLWVGALRDAAMPEHLAQADEQDTNPFHPERGHTALPGSYLDSSPSNFLHHDGRLERIDVEWEANGPVDLNLVCVRALFYFVLDVRSRGLSLFPAERVLASQIETLARAAGLEGSGRAIARLPAAEAELRALVHGENRLLLRVQLGRLLRSEGEPLSGHTQGVSVTALQREVDALAAENRRLRSRLEATYATWRLAGIVRWPVHFSARATRHLHKRARERVGLR